MSRHPSSIAISDSFHAWATGHGKRIITTQMDGIILPQDSPEVYENGSDAKNFTLPASGDRIYFYYNMSRRQIVNGNYLVKSSKT